MAPAVGVLTFGSGFGLAAWSPSRPAVAVAAGGGVVAGGGVTCAAAGGGGRGVEAACCGCESPVSAA